MKAPRKLIEGGPGTSAFAGELLREGRRESLPQQTRAAIWKSIALHAPGALAGPTAPSASGGAGPGTGAGGAGTGTGAGAAGAVAGAVKGATWVALLKGTVAVVALGGGLWAGHHALTARGDGAGDRAVTGPSPTAFAGAPRGQRTTEVATEGRTEGAAESPPPAAATAFGGPAAPFEPSTPSGSPVPPFLPRASGRAPAREAPMVWPAPPSGRHVPARLAAPAAAEAPGAGRALGGGPAPVVYGSAVSPAPSPSPPASNRLARGITAEAAPDTRDLSAAVPAPVSLLAEENRLVLEARGGLEAGRAAAVLALLEAAKRRFSDGSTLAQEREALAIEALWRLGRTGDARRRAEAFAQLYPGSPHAAHLGRITGR